MRGLEQEATPIGPPPTPNKPKKSLFAQQFESHTLEYFGVELEQGGLGTPSTSEPIWKDEVQPVPLTPTAHINVGVIHDEEEEEGEGGMREGEGGMREGEGGMREGEGGMSEGGRGVREGW